LVVYPTILPSNKGPPSLSSNRSFIRPLSLPTRSLHSLLHRVGIRTRPWSIRRALPDLRVFALSRSTPLHRVGIRTRPWSIWSTPPIQ
jgi:hypothetical protein